MTLKRYRYWKQENQFSGRVPGGMSESEDGEYVKFEDVRADILNARTYTELTTQATALGYTSMKHILETLEKFRHAAVPTRPFEIWREGYGGPNEHGKAKLLGKVNGILFEDAIQALYEGMAEEDREPLDPKKMTYWGCRLFDNEADARKKHD